MEKKTEKKKQLIVKDETKVINEINIDNKELEAPKKLKPSSFKLPEIVTLLVITVILSSLGGLLLASKFNLFGNDYTDANDPEVKEFLKNYQYIVDNYYKDVNKEDLMKGAIKGMLESLGDPYSGYLDEAESSTFNATLDGNYKGIGVQIAKQVDGNILILKVFEKSPAANAGLKENDVIIGIDNLIATEVTSSDFVQYIKDKKENTFEIKYLRDGKENKTTVKKDDVTIMSVSSKMLDKDKKIGYIKLDTFAANSYEQFRDQLTALEKENLKGLVIDLRGNTGGHLSVTKNIVSLFLNKDKIIYKTDYKGKIEDFYSNGKETKKYAIVILVDNGTASASEVLAASLKDNLNAYIIGKTTYGKGTVQELVNLDSNDEFKFTVKKWLTPKGEWINEKGIKPNVEVERTTDSDNPLNEALKYLQNK